MLHSYLTAAALKHPEKVAVREAEGGTITYGDLDRLSDRLRDRLIHLGVEKGDRVGVFIRKSIDSVAAIFGILKAGAAYVPVDPSAPASRNAYILADCGVKAVVVEERFSVGLASELAKLAAAPAMIAISGKGGHGLRQALERADAEASARAGASAAPDDDDLAAILYTSGSTGKPKGVQLSHRNVISFVEWCAETFRPMADDQFGSHAPLHFDLSLHDIYVALRQGATVVLFDEDSGKNPKRLAELIAGTNISIWYSAPSILGLLAEFGDLEQQAWPALRLVLFAGEVFPISRLRRLTKLRPEARYFNLYGPTETNVCTFHEVDLPIPDERTEPMPIGKVCRHLESIVINGEGSAVAPGGEGELCIRGSNVTRGYWNLPETTERCFITVGKGAPWYRTGDIVREDGEGNLRYLGRRDRMIKKRGYRVELGEIEACLTLHPDVREAGVVALPDSALGMKVHAHIAAKDGAKLSIIALKSFCAERIPVYMVPDMFSFHAMLPKTSTQKIDYQRLIAASR